MSNAVYLLQTYFTRSHTAIVLANNHDAIYLYLPKCLPIYKYDTGSWGELSLRGNNAFDTFRRRRLLKDPHENAIYRKLYLFGFQRNKQVTQSWLSIDRHG